MTISTCCRCKKETEARFFVSQLPLCASCALVVVDAWDGLQGVPVTLSHAFVNSLAPYLPETTA